MNLTALRATPTASPVTSKRASVALRGLLRSGLPCPAPTFGERPADLLARALQAFTVHHPSGLRLRLTDFDDTCARFEHPGLGAILEAASTSIVGSGHAHAWLGETDTTWLPHVLLHVQQASYRLNPFLTGFGALDEQEERDGPDGENLTWLLSDVPGFDPHLVSPDELYRLAHDQGLSTVRFLMAQLPAYRGEVRDLPSLAEAAQGFPAVRRRFAERALQLAQQVMTLDDACPDAPDDEGDIRDALGCWPFEMPTLIFDVTPAGPRTLDPVVEWFEDYERSYLDDTECLPVWCSTLTDNPASIQALLTVIRLSARHWSALRAFALHLAHCLGGKK